MLILHRCRGCALSHGGIMKCKTLIESSIVSSHKRTYTRITYVRCDRARNCITTPQPAFFSPSNRSYCKVWQEHQQVITHVWRPIQKDGVQVIQSHYVCDVSTTHSIVWSMHYNLYYNIISFVIHWFWSNSEGRTEEIPFDRALGWNWSE